MLRNKEIDNHAEPGFPKIVMATTLLLLALLAIPLLSSLLPFKEFHGYIREIVAQAWGRDADGAWTNGRNGYYEDLMQNTDSHLTRRTPVEWLMMGKSARNAAQRTDIYRYGGFLVYRGKPNLHLANTVLGPTRTNSYGFFDYEHTLQKPPGVRRIAIFGDSITRGLWLQRKDRYSTLLQEKLNSQDGGNFEVLNFAVTGYRLTQTFDSAVEDAPTFHPDVYVITLTELTIGSSWADHIKQLVDQGEDLKYDPIREVVKESGLRKGDSVEQAQAKLAPYRIALTRELLRRLNKRAQQQSAKMIIALVPAAEGIDDSEYYAREVDDCVQGLNIPVVDLMDTFNGIDPERVRRNWYDSHPDALGDSMIADNLYRKLRENPDAWAAITGEPSDPKNSTKTAHLSLAKTVQHQLSGERNMH